ncbi:hypothetical protein Bcep1808_7406 (plasmid) [Burkholderia vietnamiensis G4]|uniref:Uncharacterized protein n=1 Tax=Burkholderia vietnamiensis (strain G4 / LMG 22486) TaxID=269482 RepID=A4JVI0_BURVG|nr:hypothetical protein Bcep1808_7406 [Burkholderia vietnamiensis G4]
MSFLSPEVVVTFEGIVRQAAFAHRLEHYMTILHVSRGLTQFIERRGRLKVNFDVGETSLIGVHGPSREQPPFGTRLLEAFHICRTFGAKRKILHVISR